MDELKIMNMYMYEYRISNLVITAGDEFEIRDGSVVYMYIHHDYRARRMPIVHMKVELDIPTIRAIYANRETVKMKLEIHEYQYEADSDTPKIVNTTLYMQHTFSIIPAKDRDNYITSEDSTTVESLDEMKSLQIFEAYLIDMDAVNWFTQEICAIFEDAPKPTAMQALFELRSVPGNTLIATPPQDNDEVRYTILPLGDLIGNLEVLNGRYGLYDVKPWIYYDLDKLYCINWKKPNIILPSATDYGNITLLLLNLVSPDRQAVGSCNDAETKTHYINIKEMPHINDYTNRINATRFATVQSVDHDGNVDKTTLSDEDRTLRYIFAENAMTVDQMINENMQGQNVQVQVPSTSVMFLKPYKNVTFKVGPQFYSLGLDDHEYRLAGWSLSITREGEGAKGANLCNVRLNLISTEIE